MYSYKDVSALATRGDEIGCWKAVAEAATVAATMIAADFMVMILSRESVRWIRIMSAPILQRCQQGAFSGGKSCDLVSWLRDEVMTWARECFFSLLLIIHACVENNLTPLPQRSAQAGT